MHVSLRKGTVAHKKKNDLKLAKQKVTGSDKGGREGPGKSRGKVTESGRSIPGRTPEGAKGSAEKAWGFRREMLRPPVKVLEETVGSLGRPGGQNR